MRKIVFLPFIFLVTFLFSYIKSDDRIVSDNQFNEKINYFENSNLPGEVTTYPVKTAAYWTSPIMRGNDIVNLAKHDLVIVDLENKFNNRQSLLELKRLNPKIKLLAYSNPMEIFLTKYTNRPWQNQIIEEVINYRSQWLLSTITTYATNDGKEHQQSYATFWPGMVMLNMSASCPKVKGEIYPKWIAKKLVNEVLNDPIWDGYFQDNGTPNISWTHPGRIDISGNLKADRDAVVDKTWEKGMEIFLRIVRRALGPNKIIIMNKGDNSFAKYADGKFFEKFPNDYLGDKWAGGWRQSVHNAQRTGSFTIFQVERHEIMFGLASALLLDNVYLAIGQDDAGIFPELMDINLGRVFGRFQATGPVYTREYEWGTVRVEPLARRGEIIKR